MSLKKWNLSELPSAEQAVLRQMYGPQVDESSGYAPNQIQYVRELTEQEQITLGHQTSLVPSCPFRQALYKLQGTLTPLRFNRAIHEMMLQEETLRLNYCSTGTRMLAVVFRERRDLPDIVYRNMEGLDEDELNNNLQKLMERESRKGLDIRYGYQIRFSVYHTGKEEYAIIVTAAQPIVELFDVRRLFQCALGNDRKLTDEFQPPKIQIEEMAKPVRDYWSRLLSDCPPLPSLPHVKKEGSERSSQRNQKTYLAYIPEYLVSELKTYSKSNKIMLMSILQTAWGILLQKTNQCKDVTYCLLVPSRERTDRKGTGAKSMVPVRMQMDTRLTIRELVSKAFQQFVVSQPYASLGRSGIREILSRRGEMFDHFLNFCDFFTEEKSYTKAKATPEGTLVSQSSWDIGDSRLCVGFRSEEFRLVMSCLYDETLFSADGISRLVKEYFLLLQQLTSDWAADTASFLQRLDQRWALMEKDAQKEVDDSRKKVQDYLSKLHLFQECEEGLIQMFMQDVKLFVRFEGDIIEEKDLEDQIVFVVQGNVCRSIETGDGWYNTLDILNENNWINAIVLLPDRRTHLSVEVLSDQATFLSISRMSMQNALPKSPLLVKSIIQHILRQMEKYQRFWVKS